MRSNHQWVNESNGSALGHQRPRRYLEEGDWAVVTSKKVVIFDRANQPIERQVRETALSGALIGKGNYRHFMQKEIFEQPAVIGDTLQALINPASQTIHLPELPFALGDLGRITLLACGTAHHCTIQASLPNTGAKPWPASRSRPTSPRSSATARRRCLETVRRSSFPNLARPPIRSPLCAIALLPRGRAEDHRCRQPAGEHDRTEADVVLPTLAAPEIGVASTKAFTTQLRRPRRLHHDRAAGRGTIDAAEEALTTMCRSSSWRRPTASSTRPCRMSRRSSRAAAGW